MSGKYPEPDPSLCHGEITDRVKRIKKLRGFSNIQGWVEASPGTELEDTLLVTGRGAITGFAIAHPRRTSLLGWFDATRVAFSGFARQVTGELRVVAITTRGDACPVAEAMIE